MAKDIDNSPVESVQQAAEHAAQQETAAHPVRRARTIIFQIYLLAAIAIFSLLAWIASTTAYLPIDLSISHAIQLLQFAGFNPLMRLISWFGFFPQSMVVILVISIILYLAGLRWEAVFSLLLVIFDALINTVVKVVVQRPRPDPSLVNVLANLGSYSFPSGHVMFYTVYFGFLFFLVYTLMQHSWLRTLLLLVFGGLVLLVGLSRIYEGEHWASDVLAGYLLGSLILAGGIIIYRWGKPKFFANQPTAPAAPEEIQNGMKSK